MRIRGLIIFLIFGLLFPLRSFGMMSSTNYVIYADSVDAGGTYSSGGSYTLQDSTGESPVGFTSSSVYEVRGGYQSMERGSLGMTISSVDLNLGTMSIAQVNSASTTVGVTSDSESGYVLSVGGLNGTSLAGVADGSVTAGHEEYGLALGGKDKLFSDDEALAIGLNLASSSTPVIAAETVLTFKGSISASTDSGARSQSVTLSASANF